ncbi:MAG: fructose-bisphosphatase class III [Candidatus Margulisiibacteriota bacterium]
MPVYSSMNRTMGGSVSLETRRATWFVHYNPTSARSTREAILGSTSYNDAQRVITGSDGKIHKIGGYRMLPLQKLGILFRQLVDRQGNDIPGAVFPFDKHSLPMSNLGTPVRNENHVMGVKTLAVSDLHGEAYRLAQLMFELPEAEKVVVNGDIVDRGPGWWRIYMVLTGFTDLHYNWGNHDAMWFGAGVGNKPLVAELFRWLFRYNEQQSFAEKFGINFDKLEAYARANYGDAAGSYKAKVRKGKEDIGKMMEAALTAIKLKLEAQDRYPAPAQPLSESEMRLLRALRHTGAVDELTQMERPVFERLTAKKIFGLDKEEAKRWSELSKRDSLTAAEVQELSELTRIKREGADLLAIVDRLKAADRRLNDAEQEIVDDLANQLLNSKIFREMTLWFIEKGGMYTIADGNLYTHSHYPVDKNGDLRPIDGRVGKEAFDAITERVKKVGAALRVFHETGDRAELDKVQEDVRWMRFLAWDYESPLYGRVMQTWERAYLKEESGTYNEPEDPFYSFVEPKRPLPADPKKAKDKKKLKAWEEGDGKVEMAKYSDKLKQGRDVVARLVAAFGLDPETASLIKGHKPEKGDNIGKPTVHFDGRYANIDAAMSGPAADVEQGYGLILVTTDRGEMIEISIAPQRKQLIKDI